MSKTNKYSPEARKRTVLLALEARKDRSSQCAAVVSIAPMIGCSTVTLQDWVEKQEADSDVRDSIPMAESERIKALERENMELRQANEILLLISVFSHMRSSTASVIPRTAE